MPPNSLKKQAQPLTLIHHAAKNDHDAPAGSLSALENCLKTGAVAVEIDVLPLADGSFALLHEQELSAETDGAGQAPRMTRTQVHDLHYRHNGQVSAEKIGFLDRAIELLSDYPHTERLQLD
ncbi:MAG: glycerophosphodiester phosphodiesterase family protein, partial [Brevefilum sp.]